MNFLWISVEILEKILESLDNWKDVLHCMEVNDGRRHPAMNNIRLTIITTYALPRRFVNSFTRSYPTLCDYNTKYNWELPLSPIIPISWIRYNRQISLTP